MYLHSYVRRRNNRMHRYHTNSNVMTADIPRPPSQRCEERGNCTYVAI